MEGANLPDDQGKLTEANKTTAREWLQNKWTGDSRCTVCKQNNWSVGDHTVAAVTVNDQGAAIFAGPMYPHVMLICMNCGHTMFFNAALMEVLESIAKQKSENADGE